jgi:Skp family chaperone for outer membrane proteins
MTKSRFPLGLLALLVAASVAAQQPPAPAPVAAGFDSEACMKHCREMAEAHQKMMDAQKAMKEKRDAAWKEIESELASAKKARGEKKVAALEAAIEKLVAFHAEMQRSMEERPGMMGHPMGGPGMGHGMGGMMGQGMMGMCPCCQGGAAPPSVRQ